MTALTQRFDHEARLIAGLEAHGISKVDARIINDAPIMLKGAVVTEGVLVYSADEDFRVEFETLTRRQYFDYAPVARQMQAEYIQAVLNRPGRMVRANRAFTSAQRLRRHLRGIGRKSNSVEVDVV